MIRNKATKKQGVRRLAPFLAALGMLVMSSGAALMVTAGPASAANKVDVCHATDSDTNPYNFINVSVNAVESPNGHQTHLLGGSGLKEWKTPGTFKGVLHAAGDPKPDKIGPYTDTQGVFHDNPTFTEAQCEGDVVVQEAVADVDFENPSCANLNVPSYEGHGDFVDFSTLSGTLTPETHIVVRATVNVPNVFFDDGKTFRDFEWDFTKAVNLDGPPCKIVAPPGVAEASVTFVDPTCANPDQASYTPSKTNAEFEVVSGSAAPGQTLKLLATATGNNLFEGGGTTKPFEHTFPTVDASADPCVEIVEPPVDTPEITPTTAVATPTLVHAGLVSATPDLRGEQGLALLLTGMVLMVTAGALGLMRPGAKTRG